MKKNIYRGLILRASAVKYSGWGWDSISGIKGLPLDTINEVCANDVLLLPIGDEIVIVNNVNLKEKTIDLYCRGFGSTSPHQQGIKSFKIKIIDSFSQEHIDRMMTPIKFN